MEHPLCHLSLDNLSASFKATYIAFLIHIFNKHLLLSFEGVGHA